MLNLQKPNRKKAIMVATAIAATLLSMFAIYKLSYFVAPFVIAFILSLMMDPLVRFLTKRLKFKRSIASGVTLLLFLLIVGTALTLLVLKLIAEIKIMYNSLPQFFSDLYTNITDLIQRADEWVQWLPEDVTINLQQIITDISGSLTKLISPVIQGAFVTVVAIPEVLVFILVTVIATFFFSSDRERIQNFFMSQLPKNWVAKVTSIKNDMFSALFGYIRAQLILMTITFTELFIGFTIIRVEYALLLAFVISIIDALPILGTGGILIPWAAYSVLTGNLTLAVSLVALYGVVLVVRQSIEPKILGNQIGMHPLLTLFSMYVGLKLIGVPGLILGPITMLLLKNILSGILTDGSLREIIDPSDAKDQ